jgi:mannose-6-phosphate isomerase-like protein (cupin superfamily)
VVYARLGRTFEGRRLEPLLATCSAEYVSEASSREGEEVDDVLSGKLVVLVGDEGHRLSAKDGLHFDSRRPHRLANQSDTPVCVIAVTTPTRLDRGGAMTC